MEKVTISTLIMLFFFQMAWTQFNQYIICRRVSPIHLQPNRKVFLTSPGWPLAHSHNHDCRVIVKTSNPNNTLLVVFEDGFLEPCCDKVFLYKGRSIESEIIGIVTGMINGQSFTIRSEEVLFRFKTDDSVARRGFKAMLIESGGDMSNETIRNCSTYETKPGTFDFVVKNGFEQIDCFIGLEAPANKTIFIQFTTFDFSTSGNCDSDFLEVLDGNTNDSSRLTHYCGKILPSSVTTSRNIGGVRIRKTNYLGVNVTFNYTFIDDDPSQFLVENNLTDKRCKSIYNHFIYFSGYGPNKNLFCKRYFNNSENQVTVLSISKLIHNSSSDCSRDRLELNDLTIEGKQEFCSSWNAPRKFVIDGELFMTYSTTGAGFAARQFAASITKVEIAKNLTELTCFPNMTSKTPKCYAETDDCLNATCLHGDGEIILNAANTFEKAAENCARVGSLPVPDNDQKRIFLTTIILRKEFNDIADYLWIGARHDEEGALYWGNSNSSVSIDYENITSATLDYLSNKCYKMSTTSGQFLVVDCDQKLPYFCEIDLEKDLIDQVLADKSDIAKELVTALRSRTEVLKYEQKSELIPIKLELIRLRANLSNLEAVVNQSVNNSVEYSNKMKEMNQYQVSTRNEISDRVLDIEKGTKGIVSKLLKDNSDSIQFRVNEFETRFNQTYFEEGNMQKSIVENIATFKKDLTILAVMMTFLLVLLTLMLVAVFLWYCIRKQQSIAKTKVKGSCSAASQEIRLSEIKAGYDY